MHKITVESLIPTNNIELLATQVVEGFITGLHKSPFHGFSVEFSEHRIYNAGESTKHIDWKLYGRTDKLFVKRYEEETNLRCNIVIDTSASMYYPVDGINKIRFSAIAAASLMQLMRKQRDANALILFDDKISFQSDCKVSQTHLRLLYAKLEEVLNAKPNAAQTNIAKCLHELAERIHKRSLVVIFSDMFSEVEEEESIFEALQHLRYNKHEVILFNVSDHQTETEFNFSNRPYLFIDSESGEQLKLYPNQVKEHYIKALADYKENIRLKCAQFKIEYVNVSVYDDYATILQSFLVKRNNL